MGRKKHSKKISEEQKTKEFLTVYSEGQRTELPINAIVSTAKFDGTNLDEKKRFAIIIDQEIYYAKASDFEKYVITQGKTSEELGKLNQKAVEDLNELKKAWFRFGTSILAVHSIRSYRLKYGTFEEFCEKELKLHQSTVYEIIGSTLFLIRERPEIYQQLMDGKTDGEEKLPSYHSLYLLSKKRKQLEKKGEFEGLAEKLLSGKLSTRELQQELRKILLKGEEQGLSAETVVKHYEKILKEFEAINAPEKLIKSAMEILAKLKSI